MFEWILIILLSIVIILSNVINKKRSYQKGMQDLLAMFLVNGYESKVKAFRMQNNYVKPNGTVFVGDSITQDYNVYDYFHPHLVYNRGIGGDTTIGLSKRLDESIYALDPKQVVLLIGTNDFGVLKDDPKAVFERFESIISDILSVKPNLPIHVVSVYPVNETMDPLTVGFRTNHNIDLLNQMLATMTNVHYIDVATQLKDPSGRLKKELSVEGLHINEQGYQIITDILKSQIAF